MKVTLLPLALLFALASANGGIDEGQFCNKKTEGMVRCYQAEGPYKPKGRGSHDIGRRPKKGTKMKKCIDKHWVMAADCPSETFCQDFNPEHNPDPENIPLCINPSTAEVWAVPIHV